MLNQTRELVFQTDFEILEESNLSRLLTDQEESTQNLIIFRQSLRHFLSNSGSGLRISTCAVQFMRLVFDTLWDVLDSAKSCPLTGNLLKIIQDMFVIFKICCQTINAQVLTSIPQLGFLWANDCLYISHQISLICCICGTLSPVNLMQLMIDFRKSGMSWRRAQLTRQEESLVESLAGFKEFNDLIHGALLTKTHLTCLEQIISFFSRLDRVLSVSHFWTRL